MRDEEVVRANRELAAYFKGRRTEREARAALKTIKAFIRDRERADPNTLAPLPGARSTATADGKSRGSKTSRQSPRRASRRPIIHDAPDRQISQVPQTPPGDLHGREESS